MWAQDWSHLMSDLILPFSDVNLNERIRNTKWTPQDMVTRAEDLYSSMELYPMTESFWKNSFFQKSSNVSKCHGSAANMFNGDDFRMIVCAEKSLDDLYVIVHEMGHIEYYMSYSDQTPLFREGVTTAVQEAIGDAVFLAMVTPQHLSRLGLIEDKYLYPERLGTFDQEYLCMIFCGKNFPSELEVLQKELDDEIFTDLKFLNEKIINYSKINQNLKESRNNEETKPQANAFDLTLLLQMALAKIPQIPFAYIIDTFRWDLFSGDVKYVDANDYYWKLTETEMGIKSPAAEDRRNLFDLGAKFHVADNTPMMRYFLASFLQTQIFRGLCEVTLYGKVTGTAKLTMPLHRCDIYGSKKAGKLLK